MDLVFALLRTVFAFFFLLFLTRLMGRKMISQMTFFDFAVGVTIGTITGSIALSSKYSSVSAAIVLLGLSVLTILTGYINIKSFTFSKLTNSEPVTLIANGKIINENLRRTRVTISDLLMMLRKKGYFNIGDVEFAVFEFDGILSVLPKSQKQPVTPADLELDTNYKGLTRDLIIDGQLMSENLAAIGLTENWLQGELKKKGIFKIEDVFYACLDTTGNLYISKKTTGSTEKAGQYGLE